MITLIQPDWPAPTHIKALSTTRVGGRSLKPYNTFNLATHVGDDTTHVMQNRAELGKFMPAEPVWLNQTHSNKVVELTDSRALLEPFDASITQTPGLACVVMTADCLPILLSDTAGSFVAAIHAGWRGLANGIIANTLHQLNKLHKIETNQQDVLAWLGPAISQQHFEVGDDVRNIFLQLSTENQGAFIPHGSKWLCNIYALARHQLNALGVNKIYGGDYCTFEQNEQFHSYRRDGVSGRMASVIWISQP